MAPKAVELPAFGGLDLRDDPQEVSLGAAINMRNVVADASGVLRTRDGQALVTALPAAAAGVFAWKTPTLNNDRLVIPTGSNIYVFATDGTNIGSTATASTYSDFVSFGAAGTVGYLGRGAGSVQKLSLFGVLTSPAGMPNASFLAVQTPDNRLVAGDTSVGGARIKFSDPGAPETFGVNNFVDLEPYDGDTLTALVSWGNLIFAFKSNKLFVFYGNDVDGSGQPIFNFRKVSGVLGAEYASNSLKNVVVAHDGVYFVHRTGVYRTAGGTPQKISAALDPLFRGTALSPYYTGMTELPLQPGGLHLVSNRLVLRGSSSDWLIYDLDADKWMYWAMPGIFANYAAVATGPDGGQVRDRLYIATTSLLRLTPIASTDNGVAFTASYRMGFWSPGDPGAESWIRECLLDGVGTVTVKTAVNDAIALGAGQAVTLGVSPAVARGRDRRGLRGRNISYEFSGTAPWSLSRVTAIAWSQRSPGMTAA